jgi:hypothetical protein
MSAIDHLRTSDTLQFPGISYHLHTPLGDSDSGTMPFCKTKAGGTLALTLTSADLHLPIPNLTFLFTGVVGGNNITWTVNQPLDVWFSGAHITGAHGQIVTRVDDAAASLGTDCMGMQRVFEATITTIGNSNTLTVDTSLGAATASNITITGAGAGETLAAVFFNVSIHANQTPNDGCGHYYQLQGSTVRFTASVANLQAVGNVTGTTFHWDVPAGATVTPGTDQQPTLEVRLDSHGTVSLTVHVIVTTDVETGTRQSTAHFAVLTADEALLQSLICSLRSHSLPGPAVAIVGIGAGFTAGGIRFVDPLWDPTPDELRNGMAVLRRGYSLHELHQIRAAAASISSAASAVTNQVGHIIDQHDAQSKLTRGK